MTPQITAGMVAAENANAEHIQGLRELAAWIEQHPELPEVYIGATIFLTYRRDQKQDAATVSRAMGGKVQKDYSGDTLQLSKRFSGSVSITYCADRDKVCERVQVGTTVEPEHVIPAQEEQVVPAKEVPVYEWRCGSILAPAIEEAEQAVTA